MALGETPSAAFPPGLLRGHGRDATARWHDGCSVAASYIHGQNKAQCLMDKRKQLSKK